jgi:UDP-glucose-4-epimerase GalE
MGAPEQVQIAEERMKVLVTGGAGYIGSHTCKALASAGHVPIAFDNLSRGHRWAVKWGPLVYGDVRDTNGVRKAIEANDIDAVIHFAAFAYVGESVEQPNHYYQNNVGGLLSILDAMVSCGVHRIVFSSTCAVYGIPEGLPIGETTPCSPINPYGRTKLMCEHILTDHARAYDLGSIALRYFNAAGADAEGDIGEAHDPETHLIPLILQAAAGMRDEIRVMGDDYDTPDGTCIRDYIHVTDLANAHVCALHKCERGVSDAINLGTGAGYSVNEIIEAVRSVTQRDFRVISAPRRSGDPPSLIANPAKAGAKLGWRASHSDLNNIILTAWTWLEKQTKLTTKQQG